MRNINRIVKEVIDKFVDKILKETKLTINVTDFFDLSSLTPEQKKFLSTDLRAFTFNKNLGDDFNIDNEGNVITESALYTMSIPETQDVLFKELHFPKENILIEQGANNIQLILLYANIAWNEKTIIDIMEHCGWIKSQISKPIRYNGADVKVILFDPMFQDNIRDKVKAYGTLFHFSPQYNEKSILSKGLIPKHENELYDYHPKTHFIKGNECTYEEMMILCRNLDIYNYNPKNNGIYTLYSINLSQLPDEVKFYYVPHFQNGVFTQDVIPPRAIQKRQVINIGNNIPVVTTFIKNNK